MDATQIRNLAFLMSLGGLSSACGDDSRSPLTTGTASAETEMPTICQDAFATFDTACAGL